MQTNRQKVRHESRGKRRLHLDQTTLKKDNRPVQITGALYPAVFRVQEKVRDCLTADSDATNRAEKSDHGFFETQAPELFFNRAEQNSIRENRTKMLGPK